MTQAELDVLAKDFEMLRANAPVMAATSVRERKILLQKLLKVILARRADIQHALYNDYRRNATETDLADTWVVVKEIRFALRHMHKWLRPHRVATPLPFFGATSKVYQEPKGVVLIMSPWNFPFNLSFSPLVSAIAAGNVVLIKPSEFVSHSSALIKAIVEEVFPANVVQVQLGGLPMAKALLNLPFNHIFFTGSPAVGKLVMQAAALHHTSVTLELGGKTPAIIDVGINVKKVARQVAYSKFSNKGQICIATDYVLVHQNMHDEFVSALRAAISELYPGKLEEVADYPRMVDTRHATRIETMINDALEKGATPQTSLKIDTEQRYAAPAVLGNITPKMQVDEHEIFGPILPVKVFADYDELIASMQGSEKPLAIYLFTNNKQLQQRFIKEVSAGAIVVNEVFLHHFNSRLPFGGIGQSGMGKSHGKYGFAEFSHPKAVVKQWLPWHTASLLYPPYTKLGRTIANVLMRWF